jgi:hypothetical protein
MLTRDTDMIIEELINSSCGEAADPRCRHLLFHALHGLVRAARAEQLWQLRTDVGLATGAAAQLAADGISLTAGCGSGSTGST